MSHTLQELQQEYSACDRCALSAGRTTVVFGVGDPNADVMFIGEGPGYNEDKQGIPFVGPAGQLLDTLSREVGLERDDAYIANVVLCRPPGNRDPLPEEIEACKPRLLEQVRLVDPKVVVTLGNFATKTILDTQTGITRLRGQRFTWEGRTVIPTFHPAAILRGGQGRVMEQSREDFRRIRAAVEELRSAAPSSPGTAAAMEPLAEEQLGLF